MAEYSTYSDSNLSTVIKTLQDVFRFVIKFYDHTILEGFRGKERQDRLFLEKRTTVKWPNSKHNENPSKAVDAAPYPVKFPSGIFKHHMLEMKRTNPQKYNAIMRDIHALFRFYHFGGYVKGVADHMGVKTIWGGDWDGDFDLFDQDFFDLDHFELKE